MKNCTETFNVIGESSTEFTIIIHRELIDATSFSSKSGREYIPGFESLKLPDGRIVTRVDEDTFKIYETGEILKRNSK